MAAPYTAWSTAWDGSLRVEKHRVISGMTPELQVLEQVNWLEEFLGITPSAFLIPHAAGAKHSLELAGGGYLTDAIDGVRESAGLPAWTWTNAATGKHLWALVTEMRKAVGLLFAIAEPWWNGAEYCSYGWAQYDSSGPPHYSGLTTPAAASCQTASDGTKQRRSYNAYWDYPPYALLTDKAKRFYLGLVEAELVSTGGDPSAVTFSTAYRLGVFDPMWGPGHLPWQWYDETAAAANPRSIGTPFASANLLADYTTEFRTLVLGDEGIALGLAPDRDAGAGNSVYIKTVMDYLWMPYETP